MSVVMAGALAAGAGQVQGQAQGQGAAKAEVFGPANPFFAKSVLPFEAPPYDRIKDSDYEPAMLAGMEQEAKEMRAIADNPAPATFENTLVAMEKSGALLNRVGAAFSGVTGANTNPALEQVQTEMAPKMAAHEDAIYLDAKLFARVQAVYAKRAGLGLDPESVRLVEVTYERFVHAGAKLNDADKAKLKEWNGEESKLTNAFNRKLLSATKAGGYGTTDKAALAGMSESQIAAAGRQPRRVGWKAM